MKRVGTKIYAIFALLLLVVGELTVFCFAWQSVGRVFSALAGFLFALIFAPTVHELGHLSFAKAKKMRLRYIKFFCFGVLVQNGKKRFRFENPFAPEQTQVLPACGGNMKKRAAAYAIGGLVFGGVFLALLLTVFFVCLSLSVTSYFLLGAIPYSAYLFLLNLPPFEYPSGKTDTLVYQGIRRDRDEEKVLLACMEIQGGLAEGKSYSELDEKFYFDLPQLAENVPVYAMNLFFRYYYHLEKGELDRAGDALNRLASSADYLSLEEEETLAIELLYMNSLFGNKEEADKCGNLCREALQEEKINAKRALAAYSLAFGEKEKAEILLGQAEALLPSVEIVGERKSEEIFLEKLKTRVKRV